jgi:hypothetical protein
MLLFSFLCTLLLSSLHSNTRSLTIAPLCTCNFFRLHVLLFSS